MAGIAEDQLAGFRRQRRSKQRYNTNSALIAHSARLTRCRISESSLSCDVPISLNQQGPTTARHRPGNDVMLGQVAEVHRSGQRS